MGRQAGAGPARSAGAPQATRRELKKAPARGLSVSEVRAYLEAKVGKAAVAKLLASGKFKILASNSDEVPAGARRAMEQGLNVFGFTMPDGTTYLIADNLNTERRSTPESEDAYSIFLHEVGVHFGMREILGDTLFEKVIAEAKAAKGELGVAMAKARRLVPRSTPGEHVDEEVLAWLVTDRANHELPLEKRIIAKIRAFLVRQGFTNAVGADALGELACGAAVRSASRMRGTEAMFARRESTSVAYEARIDALAARAAPNNVNGVRVLDRNDVLDLLGYGDHEVVLAEKHAFDDRNYNHVLTTEEWKRLPEWIDGPVAVFERDDGKLTFIAPELRDGRPIVVGLAPRTGRTPQHGGKLLHVVVTAFGKDRRPLPTSRWVEEGRPRYLDRKKTLDFVRRSGL